MLYTNLKHIETADEHAKIINENENVVVVCGRMGPMCTPVYHHAEVLQGKYPHIRFYDMEFDNPEAYVIRDLQEVQGFRGIPFTIYYKKGKVIWATSSIQTMDQMISILDKEYPSLVNA